MSIFHFTIKIGSRGKGQSAIAAAAYRSGTKLINEELLQVSDYTRKCGVVYSEIALCANAPSKYADRDALWNAVHQIEKKKTLNSGESLKRHFRLNYIMMNTFR